MKHVAYSTVTRALDVEQGIFEALISTEDVGRDGHVVMASGGRFDAFMANPVVLFAHDSRQPPVARALEVETRGAGVRSVFQFPPLGVSSRADEVHRLWAAGFLNAVSVGFLPEKVAPLDDKRPFDGQRFLEWELVEFSIVPVPANREALRRALRYVDTSDEDEATMALAVVRELKEMFR